MSVLLEISKKLRGQNDPTREQIQKLLDETSASWKTQKDQNKLIYEEMTKLNDTTNKILDILKPTLDDLEARREGARRGMAASLLPFAAPVAAAAAGATPPSGGSGGGGFLGGAAPALLNPAVLAGAIGGGGIIAALLAARETDPEELAEIREETEDLAAAVDEFAGMDVPPPPPEESDPPITREQIAAETEAMAAQVDEFAGMDGTAPIALVPPEVMSRIEDASEDLASVLENVTSEISESMVETTPGSGRIAPTLSPLGMDVTETPGSPSQVELNIAPPDFGTIIPNVDPINVVGSGFEPSSEGGSRSIIITPQEPLVAPFIADPISTEGLTPADRPERPEVTDGVLLPDFSGRIAAEGLSGIPRLLEDYIGRTSRPEMSPFAPFIGSSLSPASPFVTMPPTVPDFSDDDIMNMVLSHVEGGRFREAASLIDNYPNVAARVGENSVEQIYRLAGRGQPSAPLRMEIGAQETLPEVNLPDAGESWPYRESRSQRIGKGASLRGLMAPMIAESGTGDAPVIINAPNNSTNSVVGTGGGERSTGGIVTTVDSRTSYPM